MEEGSEDVKFVDAESYQGGKEKLSFRQIILEHLKKIISLSCVEFRGGYWEEVPNPDMRSNAVYRRYVTDSRECYSNAVESLYDVLYPHFDDKIKEDIKEYEKFEEQEEKKLYEEYTEKRDDGSRKWVDKRSLENYKTDKVKNIKRKLFRILNDFLYRTKYMEGKTFEEEV